MVRPTLRPVFVDASRRPTVTFCTSSASKFLQASLVFGRFGLHLRHHELADEPYSEDYTGTKEQLLVKAIEEIRLRPHSGTGGSYFFIEDTSIRIESLSGPEEDIPGLSAKEWFAGTSFAELDSRLKETGDRRAVVRSDIALWVPRIGRVPIFKGETRGRVAEAPPDFEEDPLYPWLSKENFSAWLIPDGANERLSEMSFEQSWDYDFRVGAFCRLIERLEEYTVALNPAQAFFQRRAVARSGDPALFDPGRPTLAIVGPTCSGKTTFGDRADARGIRIIDASSVVRMLAEKWTGQALDATEFAKGLLQEHGYDVVARHIAEMISNDSEWPEGVAVTGLRTVEEIEYLKVSFPDLKIVSVEASQRLRFQRYLRRQSRAALATMREFRHRDRVQAELGLLDVVQDIADVRIRNYGPREDFLVQIDSVLDWAKNYSSRSAGPLPSTGGVRFFKNAPVERSSQFIRCILTLAEHDRPMTTAEIEGETGIRQNNVNKVLKGKVATVHRIERLGLPLHYAATDPGRSLARLLSASRGS